MGDVGFFFISQVLESVFSGLQEPPTPLITQAVVTLSSATMHYLKDSLIAHGITGSHTLSRANESRDSIDIQRLHQPPTGQFPPHQCPSQYHSPLIGHRGGRKWCSSSEPPAASDSCLHLPTSDQEEAKQTWTDETRGRTDIAVVSDSRPVEGDDRTAE